MRVGLITGGGDAPGLNGVIEAVGKTLIGHGVEVIGIQDGFEGIFEGRYSKLDVENLEGLHSQAGTLLGTSNKCGTEGREEEFLSCYKKLKLDGLIVAGGDGTFKGLSAFRETIPIMGVPKTIDNDLAGTEITFGYDTACSVVAESVDSLRATSQAHKRIMVVEVMGRTAGWIALGGGLTSYADVILIPERPFNKAELKNFINSKRGSQRSLVCVVSEGAFASGESPEVAFRVKGAPEEVRFGGIGSSMARWIEAETGWESRHVVLGYLQRSQSPTTTDRFLTLAMGVEIARMVLEKDWFKAAVYRDGKVQRAPIEDLMHPPRLVDPDHRWVKLAQSVGIFI